MENKIKILRVRPTFEPEVAEIDNDYRAIQKEVDGWFDVIYPFNDNVCLYCNDEGKLNGMEYCRPIHYESGAFDFIFGTFILAGENHGEAISLTDEQIKKYKEMFSIDNMIVQTLRHLANGDI